MNKKIIFLAMLLNALSFAQAQEKKGDEKQSEKDFLAGAYVKDHLTHEKVPNLKGELLTAADSSFVDTLEMSSIAAIAHIKKEGQYLMRLSAEGYVTTYCSVDATKIHKREKYRLLPNIYMHKVPKEKEIALDEVVVKATKLKFYMDGDTLVYDADAFPTAEGSMLGDLLKKLPGVEVENGGVIKVNGKQIDAMLLNGKDFFNKDRELLLDNMPSYMVKSFNAYERTPDAAVGTILEKTTKKEFVMDVRLKKEYSIGWIANAEAGGGATFFENANGRRDGKYLGRLFGLRFTKNSRLTLFANANNLNDYRNPGGEGDWRQLNQSEGLTSIVKAGANYSYNQDKSHDKRVNYQGSIDGSYSDKDNANHTSSATFLDNGNTFGKSFYAKRSYDWEVNMEHDFRYNAYKVKNLLKDFSFTAYQNLNYLKWDNATSSAAVTLAEDVASRLGKEWMDSIVAPNAGELLKRYAINRTMSSTKGIGHWLETSGTVSVGGSPAYNDYIRFRLGINGTITDRGEDTYEHYMLDYPKDATRASDYRNRYNPNSTKTQNLRVSPSMTFVLDEEHNKIFRIEYDYSYDNNDSNNPLYLLNKVEGWEEPYSHPLGMLPSMEEVLTAIDRDNSSRSVATKHRHIPSVRYTATSRDRATNTYTYFNTTLGMYFDHEIQDYQQGTQIDTLMRRNKLLPYLNVFYDRNCDRKSMDIQASYDLKVSAPSMTSLLNIRNDRDPLNITLGNPNLKNTVSQYLWLSYRNKFGRTLFNANASGSLHTNSVAYGFIYDKETGVRTTKPENVNGNWNAQAESGVDFPLDRDEKWRMKESVKYDYNHSVDLAGTNAAMEATRSTVGSHYITDNFHLKYTPNKDMEFGINSSFTYQNSTSNRESFVPLNVFTFHYGINTRLELPLGFQLSTDLTMYSRRGYSESSMNTNELVWNARLAKKLMHGNMTLMFDGFDLLGNLSNVRRTINAQGRTETFYNVIPSYGLFHVIYRLNKQPKKK